MDNRATSHGPLAASSIDGDYFGGGSRDRQVDIGQLFSDVSRTVGKFKNIFNAPEQASNNLYDSEMASDRDDSGSPLSKLFGSGSGVCFKTCGMEDIQFAARRAGEMFITMKVCMIILTFVAILCVLALTCAALIYIYKNRQDLRLFKRSSEESTVSVQPLIFAKRNPPMPGNIAPKPPAHQNSPPPGLHHHHHSPSSSTD